MNHRRFMLTWRSRISPRSSLSVEWFGPSALARTVVVPALIAVTLCVRPTPTAAESQEDPVVMVRVQDYAEIPPESIARAQRLVTRIYGAIGVRTRWQRTTRPLEAIPADSASVLDPRELLVIVLSPRMSRRTLMSDEVVGMAAVTPEDGGRIAYILFDRVCHVAGASASDSMDVMGLVMAHELAHLLLPYGSHARTGLMRATWAVTDLRDSAHLRFDFTRAQADSINQRLRRQP